jgi:hypothetical protein
MSHVKKNIVILWSCDVNAHQDFICLIPKSKNKIL